MRFLPAIALSCSAVAINTHSQESAQASLQRPTELVISYADFSRLTEDFATHQIINSQFADLCYADKLPQFQQLVSILEGQFDCFHNIPSLWNEVLLAASPRDVQVSVTLPQVRQESKANKSKTSSVFLETSQPEPLLRPCHDEKMALLRKLDPVLFTKFQGLQALTERLHTDEHMDAYDQIFNERFPNHRLTTLRDIGYDLNGLRQNPSRCMKEFRTSNQQDLIRDSDAETQH